MNGINAVNGTVGINTTGNVRGAEGWGLNTLVKTAHAREAQHDKSQSLVQPTNRALVSKGSPPPTGFWDLLNAVEFPKETLSIHRNVRVETKQFEQLLKMQSKIYEGGLVVEIATKSADAVIHGVKRLQNTN